MDGTTVQLIIVLIPTAALVLGAAIVAVAVARVEPRIDNPPSGSNELVSRTAIDLALQSRERFAVDYDEIVRELLTGVARTSSPSKLAALGRALCWAAFVWSFERPEHDMRSIAELDKRLTKARALFATLPYLRALETFSSSASKTVRVALRNNVVRYDLQCRASWRATQGGQYVLVLKITRVAEPRAEPGVPA